jgi:hypothetical protein
MGELQIFSSLNRRVGETVSDFHVDFSPTRDIKGKKLVFRMLQIANTCYNVTSPFVLDVSGTAVALTPGLYNLTTICPMIATNINNVMGAGTCLSVTPNSTTATVTFTFSVPQTLQFKTGASSSAANSLWKMLGFTSDDGLQPRDTVSGTSLTSYHACDFSFPSTLFVNIDTDEDRMRPVMIGGNVVNQWLGATYGLTQQTLTRKATIPVPLIGAVGAMSILTQNQISLEIKPSYEFLKTVHLRVTDETGATVDLQNNNWWVMFDIVDQGVTNYRP